MNGDAEVKVESRGTEWLGRRRSRVRIEKASRAIRGFDVFRERVRRKVDDWRGCYRSIVVPRRGKFTIFQGVVTSESKIFT